MNTFASASCTQQFMLLLALFLTSMLLMIQIFFGYNSRQKPGWRLLSLALFLFALGLLATLSDSAEPRLRVGEVMPVWALWCIAAALGLNCVAAIIFEIRHARRTINAVSIKLSLDTLPAAVCYFSPSGTVKLCNHQMYRLFHTMTQTDLQSLDELHGALRGCEETGGVIKLAEEHSTWLFPDGRAWQYAESVIRTDGGREYTEAVFTDVTEFYEKMLEIRRQTEKLREAGRSLKRLSENVTAMTKEQETLAFKTRLHDSLGAGIVAARQVFLRSRPTGEMDEAISLWRRSVLLLKRDNDTSPERGDLPELMRDASAIGVNIDMDGALPKRREACEVFIHAIRECLTNCVRHAGGTELQVTCRRGDGTDILTVTNNGAAPAGEIVAGGGLGDLEKRVRYCGGEMEITSRPRFVLTIIMRDPKEADR